jgi:ribosome biogenesis GTPase A
MGVQWYPGHMVKARRILENNIKLVDVVLEILDARVPKSSQNPDLQDIIGRKPKIIILNKEDLADPIITKKWLNYFQTINNEKAVAVNSLSKSGIKKVVSLLSKIQKESKFAKKLNVIRPVRAMVVGIPNVGKSMFINALVGKNSARTGNKPGITKGDQWIKIKDNLQLLDTPGILWPKIEDVQTGMHLAFINAIGSRAIDIEEVALNLVTLILKKYPTLLSKKFTVKESDNAKDIIYNIGIKRGYLLKGGQVDNYKTSVLILNAFRDGSLGKISLEVPTLVE